MTVIICGGGFRIPCAGHECPEAVNSLGKSCSSRRDPCPVSSCYRWGWAPKVVAADNRRLVKENPKMKSPRQYFCNICGGLFNTTKRGHLPSACPDHRAELLKLHHAEYYQRNRERVREYNRQYAWRRRGREVPFRERLQAFCRRLVAEAGNVGISLDAEFAALFPGKRGGGRRGNE